MNDKDMQYSQTEIEYTRGNQNHPQTKLCKYCRSEMDVRASVCPSCRKKQDHPLPTVLLIAAAVFIGVPFIVGFLNGIAKGVSESKNATSSSRITSAAERTTCEEKKTSITIKDYHLAKDYKDRDILVVNYDFYNGEKEPKSFMWLFDDKCFQNGVSCDDWVVGVDELEKSDSHAEVQPGYTQHLSVGYELKDLSDVNIIVEKYLNNDVVYIDEVLKLQ